MDTVRAASPNLVTPQVDGSPGQFALAVDLWGEVSPWAEPKPPRDNLSAALRDSRGNPGSVSTHPLSGVFRRGSPQVGAGGQPGSAEMLAKAFSVPTPESSPTPAVPESLLAAGGVPADGDGSNDETWGNTSIKSSPAATAASQGDAGAVSTRPGWGNRLRVGFDTETTGVNPTTARIVSAAVVLRVPDTMTQVKVWLLDPGVDIPPETTAVHGFTTEHVREFGQPAREGLDEIATEIASQLATGAPLVVYNAPFDLPLLDAELRRHGLPTLKQRLGQDNYHVLDPLVLDRWVDRYRKGKRKLIDLLAAYEVSYSDELHTAEVDVLAMLDLLEAMCRKWPQIGTTELPQLRLIQENAHREWAEGYIAWLAQKGLNRPGPDLTWSPTEST